MSDVYGAEMNLVRVNEEPYTGRAKYGAKSNRVRMTGLSFASFKENIRQKKIEKKVAKYNEEYRALFDLAIGVDEARQEYTEGKSDYSVVKENIELYNSQARRLAEIGVQVLMLNSDIQKISFDKESSAKALKVPGFLIGPLKMLSKAGREKARAENEARLEKERAIAEAIVATAEEAVGQLKNDEVNEEKLVSLDFANVGEMVADKLVEPTVDEEVVRRAAEEEEARRREEEAAAKAKEEAEAKERIAKLKASGDEALKKNYGKGKKSGHDGATKAIAAVEKEDAFDILRNIDTIYNVALAKKEDRLHEVLGIKIDGKVKIITDKAYGEKLKAVTGQDIPDDVISDLYKRTLGMAQLANAWKQVATREVAMEDGVKTIGAFDEENRNVFNFVYEAATNGLTFDELKAKATVELTEAEIKVIEEVDYRYEFIAKRMEILKANLAEEKVEAKETTEDTPVVSDDKTEMYKVGNAKLAELALAIYGKKAPVVEEEPAEEVTPDEVVEEVTEGKGTIVSEEAEDRTDVNEQPKVNLGFVDQIGALVAEIETLTAHRDRLRGLVGEGEAVESLNNSINERLAMINALASGGIVSLGKEGEKKEESVAEEVTDAVEEEITTADVVQEVTEEETPVLTTAEEMKVEEKAEIDARVVTGAHVHVDAKPENFSQDNRYAVAKNDPYIRFMSGALNQEEAEAFANRGILTDAEREDAIEWWSRMGALLDNPDAIKLSEMRVAEKKAEEERRALEDKVARDEFEINRQRRIAEEHERMAEQTARLQLRHCKPLEEYDIDEFIAANGQNVKEEDRFTTPSGLVRYMQKNAPNMYKEMMDSYNESMADKQAFMIENGHSFSEESVGKFAKK